jgi:hypothetical protein
LEHFFIEFPKDKHDLPSNATNAPRPSNDRNIPGDNASTLTTNISISSASISSDNKYNPTAGPTAGDEVAHNDPNNAGDEASLVPHRNISSNASNTAIPPNLSSNENASGGNTAALTTDVIITAPTISDGNQDEPITGNVVTYNGLNNVVEMDRLVYRRGHQR